MSGKCHILQLHLNTKTHHVHWGGGEEGMLNILDRGMRVSRIHTRAFTSPAF